MRSRRYRPITIAANSTTAVGLSPVPENGHVGGAPASRVKDSKPLRDQ